MVDASGNRRRLMLDRGVILGFSLMVLMLAVDAGISYLNIRSLRHNAAILAHVHEMESAASDLGGAMFDALIAQRGYLFRNIEGSLPAFHDARDRIQKSRAALKVAGEKFPTLQKEIAQLLEKSQGFLTELEDELALRSQNLPPEQLFAAVRSPLASVAELQKLVETIRHDGGPQGNNRENIHEEAYRLALVTAIISLVLGLILFAAIVELIRRNLLARTREKQRLNAEREQLAIILARIGDAVFATDHLGKILQMNRVAEMMTGFSEAEALGRPLQDVLRLHHEVTGAEISIPVALSLETSRESELQGPVCCRARDGSQRIVSRLVSPLTRPPGMPMGAVIVLRDITDERREQLAREEQQLLLSLRVQLAELTVHPEETSQVLQKYTDLLAQHLSLPLVTIWSLEPYASTPSLRAASGEFSEDRSSISFMLNDVAVLRQVVETERPVTRGAHHSEKEHLTNAWCAQRGLTEIAGYPLRAEDSLVGVLAIFSRKSVSDVILSELEGASALLSQFIQRRSAEKAQQESLTNLRRVIDSMFAFVGILDPEGHLIEANRAPLDLAGFKREDVIGQKFWDCPWWSGSPGTKQRLQAAFKQAAAGDVVRYDEVIQGEGDRPLTIDLMFQPVLDGEKLLCVIPSGVDITDRRLAEEEAAKSQAFLRSVLDALSSHIAVLDDEGKILAVNRAWQSFADENGLETPFWAVGVNYLEACESGSGACESAALDAANGIRRVIRGEIPLFVSDYPCHSPEEQRWFQMRVTQFESTGSRRVVVAHENVTERVLFNESIRRTSEQQQLLSELAVSLSAAQDVQSTMEIVTRGARRLTQAEEVELVCANDLNWTTIQRSISCQSVEPNWITPLADSDRDLRQIVRRSKRCVRIMSVESVDEPSLKVAIEGRTIPRGGCVLAPLMNLAGHNIGVIQLCGKASGEFTTDDEAMLIQLAQMAAVTLERARLYEEIRAADTHKDEFLATLAHELRNPLSALMSGTQIIQIRPDHAAQVAEAGELMMRQCRQLTRLVDDLLDVSRISRGKLNLQMKTVNLQDVVTTALESVRTRIEESQHRLSVHLPPEPVFVRGDSARLSQVLANLLVNAAKYTPQGGLIDLHLVHDQQRATLKVCDNGIGIPREMIDRIFEKFTQVDSAHQRTQGGLGIGLTLARMLVELHDGVIEAASPGHNQGSTFCVRLPLTHPVESDHPALVDGVALSTHQIPQLPVRRILVVDDNRAAVYLLSKLLISLNQTVQTVMNARAALDEIRKFQPQVVISDIGMPDLSGHDLARLIREQQDIVQPYLVALTGYSQQSDRDAVYQSGFDQLLIKPVSLNQLVEMLAAIH